MTEMTVSVKQQVKDQTRAHDIVVNAETLTKFLTFTVAGEVFGTSIDYVKEIIEHGRFTRVPLSESNIRGVINLRGHVVPIVDLAQRLGYQSQAVNKRTCIIIVDMAEDGEKMDLGFVVDAVDEVVDLPNTAIEATPGFGLDIRHDFIDGIGKLPNGNFVKLLDIKIVLSVKELAAPTAGGHGDA